jgi:hypothetical protein
MAAAHVFLVLCRAATADQEVFPALLQHLLLQQQQLRTRSTA